MPIDTGKGRRRWCLWWGIIALTIPFQTMKTPSSLHVSIVLFQALAKLEQDE